MKNDYIFSTTITNGGSLTGCITQARVYPDNIAIDELRAVLFPEKKVIPEKPKTIDQMVASALSRLHVSIKAEADWANLQITKDFNTLRYKYLVEQNNYKGITGIGGGSGSCFIFTALPTITHNDITEEKIEELFQLAASM